MSAIAKLQAELDDLRREHFGMKVELWETMAHVAGVRFEEERNGHWETADLLGDVLRRLRLVVMKLNQDKTKKTGQDYGEHWKV